MDSKKSYERKLEAKLDEWRAEIALLKAKAEQSEAGLQLKFNDQIKDLEHKQEEAERSLREFRAAGNDAWRDLTSGVELAWSKLEQAVGNATDRFR
jgi:septal ring factor EnvC (AmiA/AmiB activator)